MLSEQLASSANSRSLRPFRIRVLRILDPRETASVGSWRTNASEVVHQPVCDDIRADLPIVLLAVLASALERRQDLERLVR